MTITEARNAVRSLELRINYGIGTVEELEEAQVMIDMYLDIIDSLEEDQ